MPREVYLVGGAVRDELMGLPTADRDWVVVGATVEAMQAEGYQQVGRDFPVFLHPQTKEEYALARTERKQGSGHTGFVVHADAQVTLEEDLSRRDLTINAIAKSTDGQLIDPYGGVADIQQGVLRHVSDAFIEDPLRVLRVARFAARFPTYSIAPETQALMQRMVTSGELASLSAERVWQEFHRALGHEALPRFFAVLRDCGAQAELFPELGDSKIEQLVSASALTRYARLPLQAAEFESLANRVLAPKEFQQAAADYVSLSAMLSSWPKVSPAHLCDAFTQLGVHHQRLRLQRLVEACTARSRRDDGIEAGAFTQSFAEQIDACAVTFAGVKLNDPELRGPAYGQALRAARIKALEAALHPDMV